MRRVLLGLAFVGFFGMGLWFVRCVFWGVRHGLCLERSVAVVVEELLAEVDWKLALEGASTVLDCSNLAFSSPVYPCMTDW